jgi:hypothetical protein
VTIINPGSRIPANAGEGWTNTYEHAVTEAQRWLDELRGALDGVVHQADGAWVNNDHEWLVEIAEIGSPR